MNRMSKDEYYLNIALAVSQRSTCLVRHYGCVIVKDDMIVSTGYNGSARGADNCCDNGSCKRAEFAKEGKHGGYENCGAVHAEQNAIIQASPQELIGATAYLACEENLGLFMGELQNPTPCNICKNMLTNARISKIITRSEEICL